MRYLLAMLFGITLVLNTSCLSEEEQYRYDQQKQQQERQVQVCRDYLAACDYMVTNMYNKYGYQTDNYTIDTHGNLIMNKYVIVKASDRYNDYTIYTNRLLIANGGYIVETIK